MGRTAADYTYAVFHQPNPKFPMKAGQDLGFTPEQIKPGLLVPIIGNTYAGSSLIGLTAVLDIAKPGDRILMVSYGSGSGSDAYSFVVTENCSNAVNAPSARLPILPAVPRSTTAPICASDTKSR
jgi:hydroxymethylglutaryl-CoA synthase